MSVRNGSIIHERAYYQFSTALAFSSFFLPLHFIFAHQWLTSACDGGCWCFFDTDTVNNLAVFWRQRRKWDTRCGTWHSIWCLDFKVTNTGLPQVRNRGTNNMALSSHTRSSILVNRISALAINKATDIKKIRRAYSRLFKL